MRLSVIVPTLNEGAHLGPTLDKIFAGAEALAGDMEVIVSDGGSSDDTLALAAARGAAVVEGRERGRGVQMDRGAEASSGEVLVFIHADTEMPLGWGRDVVGAFKVKAGDAVVGGYFGFTLDSPSFYARLVELGVALRVKLFGMPLGDQALFIKREVFYELGGFRGLPIMEDLDILRRIKQRGRQRGHKVPGRLSGVPSSVGVSPRRWEKIGGGLYSVLANTLRNWFYIIIYYAGVSPEMIYRFYYGSGPDKRRK